MTASGSGNSKNILQALDLLLADKRRREQENKKLQLLLDKITSKITT